MDFAYLAHAMANMAALPVRLYQGDQLVGVYGPTGFQPDPVLGELEAIRSSAGSISYHMTAEYLLYGLLRVRGSNMSMILGPVSQTPLDPPSVWRILAALGEHASRTEEFINYLSQIPAYPLRNFLQILCIIAYSVNGEKVNVAQLLAEEETVPGASVPAPASLARPEDFTRQDSQALEQELLSYIEHGQPQALEKLYHQPVGGRVGYMAMDALRHQKNLLVSSATLCSRAAIRGGLDRDTAMELTNQYIFRGERLASCDEVMGLNTQMTLDLARRVEQLQYGAAPGSLVRQVRQYTLSHIHERITAEDLAQFLGRNRSCLSTNFKKEAGMTLTDFITRTRIGEAKRLLAVTDKPLKEIAWQLGFSSQSYFQNVFKKLEGITPAAYRSSRK